MNISTRLHYYYFDVSNPSELSEYLALKETLKQTAGRGRWLHALASGRDGITRKMAANSPIDVELETAHFFDNQWNTAAPHNMRVFDWYEAIYQNSNIKAGHYLDINDAMREARRNHQACGYCGKIEPSAKGYVFCPHCLDSEYLKEGDLHLTRMRAIDDRAPRLPLTDGERAHLMPLYVEAQIHGSSQRGRARIAAQRQRLVQDRDAAIIAANSKHDGMIWLLDNGISISNVIFYEHTGRFCFGWRKHIGAQEYSRLVDVLCEFPHDYDIKKEGEVQS